jgi:hypothetical protein
MERALAAQPNFYTDRFFLRGEFFAFSCLHSNHTVGRDF